MKLEEVGIFEFLLSRLVLTFAAKYNLTKGGLAAY